MKRKTFTAVIDAPREKVWDTLWNDKTYGEWTAPFCEGSVAKTDWNEGSKILFLDGNGSGLVSMIEKKEPNAYMSFKHLGEVRNGVEDFSSPEAKACSGGHENYTLNAVGGKTELHVEMDLSPEMEEYLGKAWPLAMEKLKVMAEHA